MLEDAVKNAARCVALHMLLRRLIQRAALGAAARCVFAFFSSCFCPFQRLHIYALYACFA